MKWLRTMACRASALAYVNDRKGDDCSISFGKGTCWWCDGWIGSAATIVT